MATWRYRDFLYPIIVIIVVGVIALGLTALSEWLWPEMQIP